MIWPAFIPLVLALAARAEAQSGFAGTYDPSPQRMEVKVSTWGEDCGTRPQDQLINESGKVVVKDEGAHLSLRFGTRTLHTNGCWSQNPSLTLVSATSASGHYRSECRTAAGDPKREQGRYSLSATPGKLELVEESDYDWQLKTSHCVAKVRVTQTLTVVGGAKPVATPAVDAAVARDPEATAAPCIPGAPARLRVRPSEGRIAPGERLCFVIKVLDNAGCELPDAAMDVTLQRPAGVQGTLTGSCFKAAESAALAEGLFKVQAASGGLRAEATVVVSAPDLSDITARRAGSGAGALSSGGHGADAQSEAGVRAVAKDARDTLWLGIAVAGAALVIALAAFIALRAARKPAAEDSARARARSLPEPRPSEPAATRAVPTGAAPDRAPDAGGGVPRICPKCRRGYPPGSERCAADGESLLDYAAYVAAAAPVAKASFCPECGQALTHDALFCGACGHKLTLI